MTLPARRRIRHRAHRWRRAERVIQHSAALTLHYARKSATTSASCSASSSRNRCPPPLHHVQACVRDAGGEDASVDQRDDRVVVTGQHQRRMRKPVQPRQAGPAGDRIHLRQISADRRGFGEPLGGAGGQPGVQPWRVRRTPARKPGRGRQDRCSDGALPGRSVLVDAREPRQGRGRWPPAPAGVPGAVPDVRAAARCRHRRRHRGRRPRHGRGRRADARRWRLARGRASGTGTATTRRCPARRTRSSRLRDGAAAARTVPTCRGCRRCP